MDNIFRKFCHYYLTDRSKKALEELQELAKGFMHVWDKEIDYGTFD
jgi:hypothetical protein